MNSEPSTKDRRALLGSALQKIQEMQARLDVFERAHKEPIAIIGMGCRFPGGADDPERYWTLLRDGVNAVREVPADRWDVDAYYDPDPETPGKSYTRFGGFLEQIDRFDPQFFGISPREAVTLDPQQRLVLEVGWEALEHAGHAALTKLRNSRTGVFIGIGSSDYAQIQMAGGVEHIDAHTGSGGGLCFAAGRFSYCLGLRGPSLSVDTACSSSLVAIHLACQSLRASECRMAVAGGVNIIAKPDVFVYLSRVKALAPDGRCKVFDAKADGFVRGEGCGMIVLKRLSDALADGDNILAIIRGSAVNQDGASTGLTVPNGPAQQDVIRGSLAQSGIGPADIDYVEAHGTGTSLGDPIEIGALAAVLGPGRGPDRALTVASVKTNLGHLEAAAGIAGLIKVVLALQHGEIPPHLHFETLNPAISFGSVPFVIPTTRQPWPAQKRRRIAGVSSFGLSGTNAHVVIEEAPLVSDTIGTLERPLHVLTLSARNPDALRELADKYARYFEDHRELPPGDTCFTTNTGRSHFGHRIAIVESTIERMRSRLTGFASDEPDVALIGSVELSRRPKIAFLFTGQGAQYAGMGQKLYESQPTFRRTIDHVAKLFQEEMDVPLLDVLFPGPDKTRLIDETGYAQPALFALEYALAELWRSWGIEPTVLVGHSVGEYAAACVGGVLSIESAVRLVAARGRLMQALPSGGAMAAVTADLATVMEAIEQVGTELVTLAALNAPTGFVLSGAERAVEAVTAKLAAHGVRSKRLTVSHAFHSPLMEPMLREFEDAARTVKYAAPKLPWISTLTGELVSGAIDARYWTRQIRESVRLADALSAPRVREADLGIEIGPAPVLIGLARECGIDKPGWTGSLRKGRDDWNEILTALGTLYTNGAAVDWAGVDRDYARRRVALPTYPFQRERYWSAPEPTSATRITARSGADAIHPLLAREVRSPVLTDRVFEADIGVDTHPFLNDHRVFGTIVFPAAAFLEMILAATREVFGDGTHSIESVVIGEALALPEKEHRTVQVAIGPATDYLHTFKVFSRGASGTAEWTLHASGHVRPHSIATPVFSTASPAVDILRARCTRALGIEAYYEKLRECGIGFGPTFRGVTELMSGAQESLGRVTTVNALCSDALSYRIHPAVLDCGLQALGAALAGTGLDEASIYLPISIERFILYQAAPAEFWSHASVRSGLTRGESLTADVTLIDDNDCVIAEVRGLQVKRASQKALLRARGAHAAESLYHVAWRLAPHSSPLRPGASGRLARPATIAARVENEIPALRERYRIDKYRDLLPGLDALARSHLFLALQQLGWALEPGELVSEDSLAEKLGIVANHRALLGRIFKILAAQQIIRRQPDGWVVVMHPEVGDVQQFHDSLAARFPDCKVEMNLIDRCGRALADALRGQADPLQLLFPDGSLTEAEYMYQDSPFARLYNSMVARAVATAIETLPADRPLRVLEIGGGTGGTTSAVLAHLRGRDAKYVFTDVSPMFLAKARDKFRDFSFVEYRVLDIERDPGSQGFAPHDFDLVVAANVVHATADLMQTMQHVQRLLSPSGLVVLLEGTGPQDWIDLTFGLTPGWWKFADHELRTDHALISAPRWIDLLDRIGYSAAASIPQTPDAFRSEQSVIIGEASDSNVATETAEAWLIFGDRSGLGHSLSRLLADSGERSVMVTAGEHYRSASDTAEIDPRQPEHYDRLLADAGLRLRGVVHLWALDTMMPPEDSTPILEELQQLACESALSLLQAVVRRGGDAPRVWLVTRGAQAVGKPAPVAILQSPVWGLGKVASLEHPELRCTRIDLDPTTFSDDASTLVAEFHSEGQEDQIAFREGDRFVARLASGPGQIVSRKPTDEAVKIRPDAAYLITGGFAGLGLLVAQWMAGQGARYLVLIGRSEPTELSRRAIAGLDARGVRVRTIRADVSNAEALRRAFLEAPSNWPALRGVIHSAGVLDDGVLIEQTWPRFRTVMRPKVSGAWNLHVLTRDLPLDFFVLFSSAAALLGSSAQSNHAAANAFLDALADHRHAQHRPAASINWGAWSDIGAAARHGVGDRVAATGMATIAPEAGLAAIEFLMHNGIVHAGVLPVSNWARLLREYAGGNEPPFISEIAQRTRAAGSIAVQHEIDLVTRLRDVMPVERRRLVQSFVRQQAAKVLALDPTQPIDIGQSLNELGLDSLMALELRNALGTGLKRTLPATLLFNYSSIEALTQYIYRNVLALDDASHAASEGSDDRTALDRLADNEIATILAEKLAALAIEDKERADG